MCFFYIKQRQNKLVNITYIPTKSKILNYIVYVLVSKILLTTLPYKLIYLISFKLLNLSPSCMKKRISYFNVEIKTIYLLTNITNLQFRFLLQKIKPPLYLLPDSF